MLVPGQCSGINSFKIKYFSIKLSYKETGGDINTNLIVNRKGHATGGQIILKIFYKCRLKSQNLSS